MKIIIKYSIILGFLLDFQALKAQTDEGDCLGDYPTDPCCNGIISTDPRPGQAYNPDNPNFVNKFNWMLDPLSVYHPDGGYNWGLQQPYNLDNPFFTEDSYLKHINAYNFPLGQWTADSLDFWPEDGWELIYKNNGYQLDEENLLSENGPAGEDRSGPVIVLYNKYSGTMRVLGYYDEPAYDKMVTTVKFKEVTDNSLFVSGLFNNFSGVSQALDQKTIVSNASGMVTGAADKGWFATDINMAYDPCVCHFPSELNFNFTKLNYANVTMEGRLIATNVPLDGSGNTPLLNGQDFLTNVYREGFSVNGGMAVYNNVDALVQKYKTPPQMSDLAKKGLELLEKVISTGVSAATGGVDKWLGATVFATKLLDKLAPTAIDTAKWYKKAKDKLNLGKLAAGALSNFLTSKVPKQGEHHIPNISFIEGELVLVGKIEDPTDLGVGNINIKVPGSKGSNDPNLKWYHYPMYNEALGLFALLETPDVVLDIYSYDIDSMRIDSVLDYTMDNPHYKYHEAHSWTCYDKINFQLEDTLKFVFNPAAEVNLEKTNIYVALVADVKTSAGAPTGETFLGDLTKIPKTQLSQSGEKYLTDFVPLSCIHGANFSSNRSITFHNSWVAGTMNPCVFEHIDFKDIKLRLMIEYEFKKNKYGKVNQTFQVLTYDIGDLKKNYHAIGTHKGEYITSQNFHNMMDNGTGPFSMGNSYSPYQSNIMIGDTVIYRIGYDSRLV